MMKSHFALVFVASVLVGAGCSSHDDDSAQALESITLGSGSGSAPGSGSGPGAGSGFDAGAGSGFDAGMGSGFDAGMGSGSDAGMGSGSDAGMGSGSDAGVGSGSDAGPGPDAGVGSGSACTDGTVVLDPYSAQYNLAGDTVVLDPHTLAGTAPYAFSASGLPPGLSISSTTGRIAGTLGPTSYVGSPYRVTVTITDSGSPPKVISVSFNWRIERKEIPRFESTIGVAVDVALPPAPGTFPFVYVVVGLPPGLSLDALSGRITGTIPPTTKPGPYSVGVSTTGGAASDTYLFLWWVFGPSFHAASEPADQSSWEGESVSLKLPLPGGSPGFSYQPANLPPGLALDPVSRTIAGTIPPGAQAASPYDVTVRAVSGDGIITAFAFRWTIYTDAPVIITRNPFGSASF